MAVHYELLKSDALYTDEMRSRSSEEGEFGAGSMFPVLIELKALRHCGTTVCDDSSTCLRCSQHAHSKKLPRHLLIAWGFISLGTLAMLSCLLAFVFVIQPKVALSHYSQNFISNNPIDTGDGSFNGTAAWLDDFSRHVQPVMCHSHNDYERPRPLFSALAAGCASVEADVWLSDDGKDLLVGHKKKQLSSDRTLQSLYIDPLLAILNDINPASKWSNFSRTDRPDGVFRLEPQQTLVLLIDVKDDPSKTWPLVIKQLEPLRKQLYLSRHENITTPSNPKAQPQYWPGPITVVGSGNIVEQRNVNIGLDPDAWSNYHDAYLDAPLDQLARADTFWNDTYPSAKLKPSSGWSRNEFYTASVSFGKAIGIVRTGFSDRQLAKLRQQLAAASGKNLTSRYWSLPAWPVSHRDYVWKVLFEEGIGLLNADDVQSAAKHGWSNAYALESIWLLTTSIAVFLGTILFGYLSYRAVKRYR